MSTTALVANAPAPMIAAPMRHSQMSVRQALLVLFFRRKLIYAVGGTILLATILAMLVLPPRYHSEAKLLVRLGRESVVIDPTAQIGEQAVPNQTRDKEINSEIELLKSRKLTEEIVTDIGPNRLLGHSLDSAVSDKDVASAVTLVESRLGVEAIPDSNILTIGFDASDPQLARDVITKLIDAYLVERSSVYRDQNDLKFFEDQMTSAQHEQADVQRKLRELRDSSGIDNPEEQRKILLQRIDSIQHDIDNARADLAATTSSIGELGKQLATLPEKQVIQEGSGAAMDSLDTMRSKLAELRLEEADLSARYTANAPPLQVLHDKIAEAEKQLQAAQADSAEKTVGINHTYEELSLRRANELANQASLQSRITALEAAKSKAQTGLSWIDEVVVKTQALEQEVALKAANVTKYAGAYEQARVDREMGRERIGNISIAEPPLLPLQAKGPSRSLLGLAGIFLAMSLGVGSVFVAESLDHTVRRVEHLQLMGLGRTISVPYVSGYYEPYHRAVTFASRGAMGESIAAKVVSRSSLKPAAVRPLKALLFDPQAAAEREESEAPDLERAPGMIRRVMNRSAGPMAISPGVLAAVRGVVEQLIPLHDETAVPRVIGVIGARPGQGASTIAVHLAVALAQRGDMGLDDPAVNNRVLLMDGDLESSSIGLLTGLNSAPGLGDWISLRTMDTGALVEKVLSTRQALLDVLPAGTPRERSPLSPRMPMVLQTLAPKYRHVVVDLPSITETEAAARMAGLCDAVVFVAEADGLRFEAAQQALHRLQVSGVKIAMAVLNKRRYFVPEWAYRLS
jgi:uncharacterized protein involved in exopolysaccharide biosynthesis/Mrp family chromosome partitioning ATPase